jgi:hypothetical protein
MENDIAQLAGAVKNKIRTFIPPLRCHSGAVQRSPESISADGARRGETLLIFSDASW